MTAKRFRIIGEENLEFIMQDKLLLPIYDGKKRLSLKECCDLLNVLNDENEELKETNQELFDDLLEKTSWLSLRGGEISILKKENEQLKEIIYEDESQIIGEWSSHIQEDMKKLNKAYESNDIKDLIRFCKEG